MIKVSIIVPVYNVEAYLAKCLDGLIKQTLKEIEIIVVNDGATDGSQKIIDEYLKKSDRIKAYIKENGGLSDARNYGLTFTTGEYIGFVDSDDFVEVDMYEILYEKAKEMDSDVVECNLRHTYKDYEDIEIGKEIYDKNEMLMFGRSVVWNKIYKRDWLLGTAITFPKGLIYEDVEFFIKLVPHIKQYDYIEAAPIHYVQRSSSLNNKSSMKTLDILKILDNIREYYVKMEYYKEYEEPMEFFFARILLCSSVSRMCKIPDHRLRNEALKKNFDFLIDKFPMWKKNKILNMQKSYQGLYMRSVNKITYRIYSRIFPFLFKLRGHVMNR